MAEVRNRATLRAAGLGKERPTLLVTDRASVVPMEHVESYYNDEIAREGRWRGGVPLVILRPKADRGKGGIVRSRYTPTRFRAEQ